jgi:hypothetical protein
LSAYLKNFIAHSAALEQSMLPESLAKVRAAHERFKAADSDNFSKDVDEFEVKRKLEIKLARHEELEARTALTKIALYCLKLICRLDKTEIEDSEMSLDSRGGQAQAQMVRNVCAAVIGRAPLTFEVVLLTGSEYRFTVKYGDIDTPYSILPILYGRLVGSQDELRHMMDKYNLKSKHRGPLAWQDWLMKQFRGFAFYSIDADKSVDTLLDIPVQAEESALCPWHNDILWNLVFNRIGASSQDQGDKSLAYGISGDIDTLIGKKFVLRRRIACSSELLVLEIGRHEARNQLGLLAALLQAEVDESLLQLLARERVVGEDLSRLRVCAVGHIAEVHLDVFAPAIRRLLVGPLR